MRRFAVEHPYAAGAASASSSQFRARLFAQLGRRFDALAETFRIFAEARGETRLPIRRDSRFARKQSSAFSNLDRNEKRRRRNAHYDVRRQMDIELGAEKILNGGRKERRAPGNLANSLVHRKIARTSPPEIIPRSLYVAIFAKNRDFPFDLFPCRRARRSLPEVNVSPEGLRLDVLRRVEIRTLRLRRVAKKSPTELNGQKANGALNSVTAPR